MSKVCAQETLSKMVGLRHGASIHLFGTRVHIPPGDNPEGLSLIATLLEQCGIHTLLRPNTARFNRLIIDCKTAFHQKFNIRKVTVYTDLAAEGVIVFPGEAALIRVADCAACYVAHPHIKGIAFFRAGLRSIVSDNPEKTGVESVVRSAVNTLLRHKHKNSGILAEDLSGGIILGIRGGHFVYSPTDPVYGTKNQRLLERIKVGWHEGCLKKSVSGGIRLRHLIRREMRHCGLANCNIEITKHSPVCDVDESGQHLWHSHVREGQKRQEKSNAVLLINPPQD
ncbi:MAG: hypothetical protein AAB589_02700 [Patescibacteria group bacterium]